MISVNKNHDGPMIQIIICKWLSPKGHFQNGHHQLFITNCLSPNDHLQMVIYKWSSPNGHLQMVISKWSFPNGYLQMVISKWSYPIDYHNMITMLCTCHIHVQGVLKKERHFKYIYKTANS